MKKQDQSNTKDHLLSVVLQRVILCILLLLPLSASAEVTRPYTVDEKPQVLFGDSVPIVVPLDIGTTTYYGLEHYNHDYVGGYAHITFTYTHHMCCSASYPPRIYIHDIDPRSTTTNAVEKTSTGTYNIPSGSDILTDWYFYDIQFSSTGFDISVREATTTNIIYQSHQDIPNLSDTDWVSLANLYPSQDPALPYSMAFTPFPLRPVVPSAPKLNPVIIIPGIMGSAEKNGTWYMDPILHTYDDLIATLVANGYVEGKTLFTFPYEWRDSNVITASLLKTKISQIKQTCLTNNLPDIDCTKVDLVAHSMGGLVAREYIEHGSYQGDINHLVFLGTPQKGAVTDYLRWEAGEFGPGNINVLIKLYFQSEALHSLYPGLFSYIHGRPVSSVQELLPVFDYLKDKSTGVLRPYSTGYPRNIFLEALNNPTGMSTLLGSGIKITNIVGDLGAASTIDKIRVVAGSNPLWVDGKPDGFDNKNTDQGLENGNGDGTVTLNGATLDSSITNIISNSAHTDIPSTEEGRVYKILTGKDSANNVHRGVIRKLFTIHLHSPVDMVVVAPDGKKIGKNFGGGEYNEIPDAFYSGYNTSEEYITIPNPLDGDYKIQLQGTGSGGYDVQTSFINDATSTSVDFVGTTTINQLNNIDVRLDTAHPEALSTDVDVVADINMAYNLGWVKDTKTRDALLSSAKLLIKYEQVLKGRTQVVERRVDKVLAKLMKAGLDLLLKSKSINQQAYNLLKSDLDWIINH